MILHDRKLHQETHSLYRWICRRWSVKIKSSKETVHGVKFTVTWREIVERKLDTGTTIKHMDDLARAKGSPARARARAKGKQDKGKGKGKPGMGKGKNKKRGKHYGKKGKNLCHEMEGHEDKQETQTT